MKKHSRRGGYYISKKANKFYIALKYTSDKKTEDFANVCKQDETPISKGSPNKSKQTGGAMQDFILIILIILCTMSALNKEVRIQVRRVGSARVTPRPMRRQEWMQ